MHALSDIAISINKTNRRNVLSLLLYRARPGDGRTLVSRVHQAWLTQGWHIEWTSTDARDSQFAGRPEVVSVDGRLAADLANNVSDAFRPHLGAVLAITWYFAVIACVERCRSTISGHRDLTIQHHDAHIEIAVRMALFGEIRFLTAINHLKPFAPQIALESLSRKRPAIAAATGDIGHALGANLFGMQAAGGDFTTLPGTECFRVVVARYGDLAAKDE